jgi:hypothetical protein
MGILSQEEIESRLLEAVQVARDRYKGGAGNLNEYANALKLLNNFLTYGTTAMVTKWIDDERQIEEEMRD